MKFNVWKTSATSDQVIRARHIDAAADKYMVAHGDAPCDCISDHITLLMYDAGVVAIVEDGYAPDASDFSPKP